MTMTLVTALLGVTTAAAFSPSFEPRASLTSSSALSLSNANPSLPFFAAEPAFGEDAASGTTPQSATVTLRLPLGTLFDGRDYTFITESNVRGYEWTTKETDILLDDLMDAALGSVGGAQSHGNESNAAVDKNNKPPPAIVTDYELSQIVLVPTSDWDSNSLGLGNRYDVYDGQQRLVTLNLLLAGLRDSFQSEADELQTNGKAGGGKRAVALAATANEISGMLMPTKVRKEDVMRITLRKRDNVLLNNILIGDAHGAAANALEDDEEAEVEVNASNSPPTRAYPKLTPKQKSSLLSPLSPTNARIFRNFVHLSDRLASLTTRERLRLLDYVVERVYLLVCIPETSRIARNIVMSQGRKGMDNEPVDDFKGLVCFRYTLEEEDMYRAFDLWDGLAREPTTGDAADGGAIASVGRDVVSSACNLRASASLRTKIRGRGGDEVYEWERWLRQELWLKNRERSRRNDSPGPWQGRDFFAEEIEPASVALYKFRNGRWDDFSFLSKTGKGKGKMTKRRRETIVARLDFLRDVTMGVAAAKEAEIAVLELLLRAEEDCDESGGNGMLPRYLDELLPSIETWTLWMALARPSPMQRHARVFALLDAMDDLDSVGSSASAAAFSGGDRETMVESLRESTDGYEFGASAGGKRLAAAMLKRMNFHLMAEEKKSIPSGDKSDAACVEIIQQHWSNEEEREEWSNRLGNLALVSSRPPRSRTKKAATASSPWEGKQERLKKEPWPLTRQLAELDRWGVDAVRDQQIELLSLVDLVWSLGSIHQ